MVSEHDAQFNDITELNPRNGIEYSANSKNEVLIAKNRRK